MSQTGDSSGTGHCDHHVHFDAATLKDDFEFDSSVTYQRTDDGIVINLGFLQINHRYEIDLKLPSKLFGEFGDLPPPILTLPAIENLDNNHKGGITGNIRDKLIGDRSSSSSSLPSSSTSSLPSVSATKRSSISNIVPNLHCRITDFSGYKNDKNDYFEMKIEFFAYKEKLIKEQLIVLNSKNSKEIFKLIITARVLGKGKGTPMLKNGIHCIGVERDGESESEVSDFSGFGKSN